MSEKMPESLRKHFESKEKGSNTDENSNAARKEALRKAKKAKIKRNAEKNDAGR